MNRLNPDFVGLKYAWPGIETSRITRKEEVRNGISEALSSKGHYIVDIWVNETEDVMPMIPPGGTLNDLMR